MPFVCALAGACFLISSFFLVRDKAAVKSFVSGETEENRSLITNSQDDEEYDGDEELESANDVETSDEVSKIKAFDYSNKIKSSVGRIHQPIPNGSIQEHQEPSFDPMKV